MTLDLHGTPVEGRVLSTYRDEFNLYGRGECAEVSRVEVDVGAVLVALVVAGEIVGWEP